MLALGQKRTKNFSFFRFHPFFGKDPIKSSFWTKKRMKQKISWNTNETKKKTGTNEKTTKPKKKTGYIKNSQGQK